MTEKLQWRQTFVWRDIRCCHRKIFEFGCHCEEHQMDTISIYSFSVHTNTYAHRNKKTITFYRSTLNILEIKTGWNFQHTLWILRIRTISQWNTILKILDDHECHGCREKRMQIKAVMANIFLDVIAYWMSHMLCIMCVCAWESCSASHFLSPSILPQYTPSLCLSHSLSNSLTYNNAQNPSKPFTIT